MRHAIIVITAAAVLLGLPAESAVQKRLEFRAVAMAEVDDREATEAGFSADGFGYMHLGSTLFKASDGEVLFIEYAELRSPEEARRYLDWNLAKSSKILTQGTKTDSNKKSVGYRAEVLRKQDQPDAAVMWTAGAMFRVIYARTLADALELEKRYGH